ncbi:MAG: hypothetical protein OXE86_00190 [Alphaproteobacteria bacterium]|nr:hypothetical protein [Alphaproteobacteria bacterium]
MIIVIIHWKIKPDMVNEFLDFWRMSAVVNDRNGLIGEFLGEEHSAAEFGWITWPMTGCKGKYRSFVNVGYWNSGDEFQAQVGRYFDLSTGPKDFEAEPRLRTALRPKCWRIGDSTLPIRDSRGVL